MTRQHFARLVRIALMTLGSPVVILASVALVCGIAPAWGATPVMVQDFEKVSPPPIVWVVNIPNENASVQLSTDQPHDGKQCLKLRYRFVGTGNFQYLGIPNKVRIQTPIHALRFWLKGDNSKCSYGVQVSDASGETHQYSKNTGQAGMIDFAGWKEVVINLHSVHETWGGDKLVTVNGSVCSHITAAPSGALSSHACRLVSPPVSFSVSSPSACGARSGMAVATLVALTFASDSQWLVPPLLCAEGA